MIFTVAAGRTMLPTMLMISDKLFVYSSPTHSLKFLKLFYCLSCIRVCHLDFYCFCCLYLFLFYCFAHCSLFLYGKKVTGISKQNVKMIFSLLLRSDFNPVCRQIWHANQVVVFIDISVVLSNMETALRDASYPLCNSVNP